MVETVHDLNFCTHVLHHLLTCYRFLPDLLDSIDGASFFMLGLPDCPV